MIMMRMEVFVKREVMESQTEIICWSIFQLIQRLVKSDISVLICEKWMPTASDQRNQS